MVVVGWGAEMLLWAREKGMIVEADETRVGLVLSLFSLGSRGR